jgi:signal transducing adaptor molecule
LPELTSTDIAREAEAEASVFAQAVEIDKLLNLLRNFDISKQNLADDDDIQVSSSQLYLCISDSMCVGIVPG